MAERMRAVRGSRRAARRQPEPAVARPQPAAGRLPGQTAGVPDALTLLELQATVGNAVVSRLVTEAAPRLVVQRQPDGQPPAVPPAVSPADRERQIYAATTMRSVPAPDPQVKANLAKAISFAPVYDDIQSRNKKRDELKARQDDLDRANNELSIATESRKDVAGAPGGTGPGSGEPEKATERLEKAKAEVARLSQEVEALGVDLKQLDGQVTRELTAIGVKDDQELVTFVEETFPKTFADRGKQIAVAQLEANRKAAEKERDRYQAQQGGGDRDALKAAANDLDSRTREIAAIWSTRTTTLPQGGADPDDPGVREFAEIQNRVQAKQDELDKKTAEYRLKFPILFKVDPQQIAATADKDLDALLNGPIGVVLGNIDKTEANINDDSLKVWKLRGKGADIVQLTKDDMGVKAGDTLDQVVEKYAADDKTTGEVVTDALNALSMVADVIGLVTGPVGMAVAGGISAVAAVANVVQQYNTASALDAAGNVAIDPDAAKMATELPDFEGLIYGLAMAGIAALGAAGAIRAVVNQYRQALAAAKDFDEFKKAIRATSLDDAVKDRLIVEAERQYAKAPVIDATVLRREFDAIGGKFTLQDRVGVARVVSAFGSKAATKTFLELEGKKIFALTEANLDAALDAHTAAMMKARYFGEHPAASAGVTVKGVAFIKPGSYGQVAEAVDHEVVHLFQQRYEQYYTATLGYYTEHQAFLESQRFLRTARAKLGEAEFSKAFADSTWLVDATDEQIRQHIERHYGFKPSNFPTDRDEMDAFLQTYIDQDEKARQRAILQALAKRLDKR